MQTPKQPATYLIVVLTDLSAYGDVIPEGTTLEVDRAVRNDWKGSKLCRDATDEEVAAYRAGEGDLEEGDDLEQRRQVLSTDIGHLEQQYAQVSGQISQLNGELATLQQDRAALVDEVAKLQKDRDALVAEVAALEKAKAAAAKK